MCCNNNLLSKNHSIRTHVTVHASETACYDSTPNTSNKLQSSSVTFTHASAQHTIATTNFLLCTLLRLSGYHFLGVSFPVVLHTETAFFNYAFWSFRFALCCDVVAMVVLTKHSKGLLIRCHVFINYKLLILRTLHFLLTFVQAIAIVKLQHSHIRM